MEQLVDLGYIGLFLSAFLAATILPLSSEVVLGALLINDWNPFLLVLVATVGNVLGSIVNYGLGYWGNKAWLKRKSKEESQALLKAEQRFRKWGMFSLCFAWVPVIGDPITVVAGILKVRFIWFLLLVTLGKCGRYVAIAYFALQVT